jgi:hypothetical protein
LVGGESMEGNTNIIRHDRGLDFRRIEQFIKMFHQKCVSKSSEIERKKTVAKNTRKAEAFEHFGITGEVDAIKAIDEQIEELKKQRKVHEEKVRDFTQGQEKRYNTYDDVRENSPIQLFIDNGCEQYEAKRNAVWALYETLSNELWYAKDLEQAVEIIGKFEEKLNENTVV